MDGLSLIYRILTMVFLFMFSFADQNAKAQSKEIETAMFSCLHELPQSSRDSVDSSDYSRCLAELWNVCHEFDIAILTGETTTATRTTKDCFLSMAQSIQSQMLSRTEEAWTDKNSIGFHTQKVSVEYAIKKAVLECEFLRAQLSIGFKPWLNDIEAEEMDALSTSETTCLFHQLVVSYTRVIVFGKLP